METDLKGGLNNLLFPPPLQLWQYVFAHMSCHIFRHSHLNAEFYVLLNFLLKGYSLIQKVALLKAVKTIIFTFTSVSIGTKIFILFNWHTTTLTNWLLRGLHTRMKVAKNDLTIPILTP